MFSSVFSCFEILWIWFQLEFRNRKSDWTWQNLRNCKLVSNRILLFKVILNFAICFKSDRCSWNLEHQNLVSIWTVVFNFNLNFSTQFYIYLCCCLLCEGRLAIWPILGMLFHNQVQNNIEKMDANLFLTNLLTYLHACCMGPNCVGKKWCDVPSS